jgi:hypothetical protein
MVIVDDNDPCPAPDWETAEGDSIAGVELALREAAAVLRVRHRDRERRHAQKNRTAGAAV